MEAVEIQTRTGTRAALDGDAVTGLRQSLRGELITPESPAYDGAGRVWNGLIDKRPALIARCSGVADVMAAVNFAREHDVLLSIRGGGHNVAGNAICDGGLVVDLSPMRGIHVDPVSHTVQVQGGATLGDLDHETQAFGLAVPVGLVRATGIAGLTLHGGMGWLTRRHGLTLDALTSVDVVTADGRLVKASELERQDLFWAIRGGGGNFGVVTSFDFRAHPVGPDVWFVAAMYPMLSGRRVLQFLRDFMVRAPEELTVLASLWSASDEPFIPQDHRGSPVIMVLGCYSGPFARGEEIIRPLREIGKPIVDLSGPRRFVDVQKYFDADYPDGMLYYWKSAYLRDLTDEVIDALIEHARTRPSPLTSLDIWFLEGAMNRIAPDRTAYARRHARYVFAIESNWADPEQSNTNIAWTRQVFEDMQRFAQGSYLNFPGFVEDADKLLQGAYGPNYERLRAIKTKYDPDNLFRGVLNIAPRR